MIRTKRITTSLNRQYDSILLPVTAQKPHLDCAAAVLHSISSHWNRSARQQGHRWLVCFPIPVSSFKTVMGIPETFGGDLSVPKSSFNSQAEPTNPGPVFQCWPFNFRVLINRL